MSEHAAPAFGASGGRRPRGRYAPTPSGLVHVGNARTALVAWLSVRSRGGSFVWRLEDLDPPRAVEGMAEAALEDLAWLGLDWDEGGGRGGPYAPYEQSARSERYVAALERLAARDLLFPCRRSRKDLRQLAVAPHGPQRGVPPYPSKLRPPSVADGWLERLLTGADEAAVRFKIDDRPVEFVDRVFGAQRERVDESVGDFVLRRRDGLWAYQLAVVVDDLEMGIDDVVRGSDLLASTARQIRLIEALGGTPPAYAHVPLVVNADGDKLSKRDGGLTLRSLRARGVDPRALVGYLAWSLGIASKPSPRSPGELAESFDWSRIGPEDHRLPLDLPALLLSLTRPFESRRPVGGR